MILKEMFINNSWTESERDMAKYRKVGDKYYITCRMCGEEKIEDEFHRNKNNAIGRAYACMICLRPGFKKKVMLDEANEHDASIAKEILIGMGYDIEKNIHTQFLQRMKNKGINL